MNLSQEVIDNSENRRLDVFFYGLYMDPDILEKAGAVPENPRIGYVENYALRIGNKATLLRAPGKQAHGLVYSLTHNDINKLYWGAGLHEYAAEALLANVGGELVPVLCCNLIIPPADSESNAEYGIKLEAAMKRLGVPVNIT